MVIGNITSSSSSPPASSNPRRRRRRRSSLFQQYKQQRAAEAARRRSMTSAAALLLLGRPPASSPTAARRALLLALALLAGGAAGRLSEPPRTSAGAVVEHNLESSSSSSLVASASSNDGDAAAADAFAFSAIEGDDEIAAADERPSSPPLFAEEETAFEEEEEDGEWDAAVVDILRDEEGDDYDVSARGIEGNAEDDDAVEPAPQQPPSSTGLRSAPASRRLPPRLAAESSGEETAANDDPSSSFDFWASEVIEKDKTERDLQTYTSTSTGGSSAARLETTFVGGSRSYGNMFDIQANADMTVTGLDIHCGTTSLVNVDLFTRSGGSYNGIEYSLGAWTLLGSGSIWCSGPGVPSSLPSSFFPVSRGGGLDVAAGETRAFYVAMDSPYLYYTVGYNGRGAAVSWNADLTVFAGNGVGYKKFGYPVFAPRVWNGAVRYRLRRSIGKQATAGGGFLPVATGTSSSGGYYGGSAIGQNVALETTKTGTTGSYGNMFDIRAAHSVLIKGFDIHVKKKQVTVTIYTRPGSYVGQETDKNGWTLMLPPTVLSGQGQGRFTTIPTSRFIPMDIGAGGVRAFYVKLISADLRYSKTEYGVGVGDVLASNSDLAVMVGAGMGSASFGEAPFEPRAWNGSVKYAVESYAPPPSSPSSSGGAGTSAGSQQVQGLTLTGGSGSAQTVSQPTDFPTPAPMSPFPTSSPTLSPTPRYKSFATDFTGDNGSYGNMFSVIAPDRDIIIRSFAIHVGTTDPVQARVWFRGGSYKGYENEPVGWITVMSTTELDGRGYLRPTELPEERFRPIKIPAGKIGSFYVTLLQKQMRYTNWESSAKGSFVGNSDVFVTNGAGIGGYPFGTAYENRMWNGIIRYEVVAD